MRGRRRLAVFPSGQEIAALSDTSIPALWQTFHDLEYMSASSSVDNLRVFSTRISELDVFPKCVIEQVNILKNHGDILIEFFRRNAPDVHPPIRTAVSDIP